MKKLFKKLSDTIKWLEVRTLIVMLSTIVLIGLGGYSIYYAFTFSVLAIILFVLGSLSLCFGMYTLQIVGKKLHKQIQLTYYSNNN